MNDPKRILVTGATGFLGSHLVKGLDEAGYEVHGLMLPHEKERVSCRVNEGISFHELKNGKSIYGILSEVKPVVVFHLAAYIVTEHKTDDVDTLVESNILFGARLLEAMEKAGCRSLITTSTTWEHYGDAEYDPVCLYAATKRAFEDILRFYINAKKFKSICLKLYDTYGPSDHRAKLIPQLFQTAANGDQTLSLSEGRQKLSFTFADDLVRAYLVAYDLLCKLSPGEYKTYFLKPDEEIVLRDLVRLVEKVTGRRLNVKFGERPYREREVMNPCCIGENLPGWSARIGLEEGLKKTWESRST